MEYLVPGTQWAPRNERNETRKAGESTGLERQYVELVLKEGALDQNLFSGA